ncbi:rhomboid family intramembrane serine protease [candidate division KSB1 bacterium]|nr:rhomboid family intramembrane serine protease [candidate division KSB1 bacterium]RQW05181.1 MAG: rhomboid family intramembrane serine protease [candidate division KSB1 bacterium]
MRYPERTYPFAFGGGLAPIVRNLILANAAIWILQQFTKSQMMELFALHPLAVVNDFTLWQLFTYMFLHGSFFHLFFNMFVLFMFGSEVARILGARGFLRYYVMTGMSGGIVQLIANWGTPSVILGASAAVYGVLVAFALFFPNRIVTLLLFFVLPVQLRAKTLVAISIGISLILGLQSEFFGTTDHVAHFAHLGGAFAGLVLLRGHSFFERMLKRIADEQLKKRQMQEKRRQASIQQKRKDIDTILDRINEIGYENISEAERNFLKEASEFLSKEEKIKP